MVGAVVATGTLIATASARVQARAGVHAAAVSDRVKAHDTRSGAFEYGCPILPEEDSLNQEIVNAPVNPNSTKYLASIGLTAHLHPDFGTEPSYGIPDSVVGPEQQPDTDWNDENLEQPKHVPGSEFEAVESGPILHG